eukprot:878809-Amphidinium_carterae.1
MTSLPCHWVMNLRTLSTCSYFVGQLTSLDGLVIVQGHHSRGVLNGVTRVTLFAFVPISSQILLMPLVSVHIQSLNE